MDEELNKFLAWGIALRGIISILFGVILMFFKFDVAVVFITVFGIFLVLDGLFAFFESFSLKKYDEEKWYMVLIEGLLKVLAGVLILFFPIFTSVTYIVVVQTIFAIWAVITGLGAVAAGFSFAKGFLSTVLYILLGIFLFIVGLSLFLNPISSINTFIFVIGLVTVLFGVISLGGALVIKNEKI